MTYRGQNRRARAFRQAAPIALLAAVLAGCSSGITDSSPSASSASGDSGFRQRMANLFYGPSGDSAQAQASVTGNTADPAWDCPTVDVRTGASTLQVNAPGEPSGSTLRYQASIARVARECVVAGPSMTVKVGVQGRVIMGQAGSPGQMEVPLRYALVREGPTPRTIMTKLHRFPVAVNETTTSFMHVEEDITFPIPPRGDLDNYVVYVGFDPAPPK